MWNNNGYGCNCDKKEEKRENDFICTCKCFEKKHEEEHKCCNCCKKEEKKEDKKYEEVEVKFYFRPEEKKYEYEKCEDRKYYDRY